jgi:dolichol-phosphate mannosyltransferase
MPQLSFVIPVYGSPHSLEPLTERINAVCRSLGRSCEIILVDDRCPKGSWTVIKSLVGGNPHVKGLRLSRNFGQHAAIQAGLRAATGEWIVVMDCDLQDQPEEVAGLLKKAVDESFDIVRARRTERNDSFYRRAASKMFYGFLSFLTDTHQSSEIANFGIYHKRVIDEFNRWTEQSKYFPAMIEWMGFNQASITIKHSGRFEGSSSYTITKLVSLATNIIIGFSDKPLKILMISGMAISILTLVSSIALLFLHFSGMFSVEGWASVMLSLWFIGGFVIFGLGLTGLYVGRALIEAKGRPVYIMDTILNGGEIEEKAP